MPPIACPDLLVAIGDLHGHLSALAQILAALQDRHRILDRRGRLREGVTLVFTGDYVDRGTGALPVIATLKQLARDARGEVVTLLGNHEIMALEATDVAAEIAAISWPGDPVALYEDETVHGLNGGGAFVREFGRTPGEAIRAYATRMSRAGDVGSWLRQLRPFHRAQVGDVRVLFMHGDLSGPLRGAGAFRGYGRHLRRVLSKTRRDPGGREATWGHPALGSGSIFWSRSFGEIDPEDSATATEVCRSAGVDAIVTGHTPGATITCRGGRLFDVDVGMAPACGGNEPQALVLEPGRATALTASGSERELTAPVRLRARADPGVRGGALDAA